VIESLRPAISGRNIGFLFTQEDAGSKIFYNSKREMPFRIYAGVKYTQVRHAIQCKKCLDTIESKYINDFKYCSCGAVGIDGGISAGNRILGDIFEDRRMYCAIVQKKKIWLPLTAEFRN
jgi:hypothetical protein